MLGMVDSAASFLDSPLSSGLKCCQKVQEATTLAAEGEHALNKRRGKCRGAVRGFQGLLCEYVCVFVCVANPFLWVRRE